MAKGNTVRKERKARMPINASRPRTRGQRGKLHDPATNTAELTAQLRSMGLYAAPTLGDGNCLFRALSDQIYGTPNEHLVLRKDICTFMGAHKERFEAFVDDDRSWDQHISAMRNNGTYGGHLELTAFAQLKSVNVKVVQPGLVYVIEGAKADTFGPSTSASAVAGGEEEDPTSSRDKRKAKKERIKKKAAERAADEDYDDDDDENGSAPFPGTVYVAYHDWEHFSSVRNLTGPHQGMPDVCEVPEPDTSSLPSPPPSQATTKRGAKQKSHPSKPAPVSKQQPQSRPPTPSDSDSLSPPPSRSPKRAMDEDDEEDDENEARKRNRRGTITVTPPDEEAEEDVESEFAAGVSSSVSAESGSFISDAPPPPPPPEPEPEPELKLTKRQRKSLGVPKARSSTQQRGRRSVGPAAANKGRASTGGMADAPKRETRSATKAYRDAGKVRDVGTGEWLDNGTGRLDVRGFRELRI